MLTKLRVIVWPSCSINAGQSQITVNKVDVYLLHGTDHYEFHFPRCNSESKSERKYNLLFITRIIPI